MKCGAERSGEMAWDQYEGKDLAGAETSGKDRHGQWPRGDW
jgi:hypothetical protein